MTWLSSLRITVGRFTTAEEVDYIAGTIEREVARLREMSPPAFNPTCQPSKATNSTFGPGAA